MKSSPESPPPSSQLLSSHNFIVLFLLLLFIPIIFFVAPNFIFPKTLPQIPSLDESEDLALFRRATLSSNFSRDGRTLPSSVPKIAFLFLTTSSLPFSPIWEQFFSGHEKLFNIYVHSDPSVPKSSVLTNSSKFFEGRFIQSKATQRASPTLISAVRRLLANALIDDPSNAFFALVSDSCIPLHSFRYTYRALIDDPSRRKYRSFIEILSEDPNLWRRYVARGDDVMMPEVPFERFRVGSQFFVLARRHAVVVVRDRRLWKKFKMPCLRARKNSCYPEEHYFPTLLEMQDPEGCSHYTLTRVNWTETISGHPHTYRPPEVSGELIRVLRKSNSTYSYLFARKFSPDCLDPLLKLTDNVIFRD